MNDHIQDVTRRFADAGYHAVAPALFHRAGGGTAPYDDFEKVLPAVRGAHRSGDPDGRRRRRRRTCTRQGFDDGAIGIVGFCMGGRVTFLVSLERALGAAVGFYGGGIVTARFPQFPPLIDRVGEPPDAVARPVRRRGRLDPGRRRRARSAPSSTAPTCPPRSCATPAPSTASTATCGRATTPRPPPTRGPAPSRGSRSTWNPSD